MAKAKVTMTISVEFDPQATDPESLASALDILIDNAIGTTGILDDYGPVQLGPFEPGAEVVMVEE